MTTIQASTQSIQTSSGGNGASGGNDISAQITRILDKIQKLTQQLNELANSPGSTEDKKKQDQKLGKVEGVNSPTDKNQINIYI